MRTNREFEEGEIHEDPAGIPKFGEKMHEDGTRSSFRAFFTQKVMGKCEMMGRTALKFRRLGDFLDGFLEKRTPPPSFPKKIG